MPILLDCTYAHSFAPSFRLGEISALALISRHKVYFFTGTKNNYVHDFATTFPSSFRRMFVSIEMCWLLACRMREFFRTVCVERFSRACGVSNSAQYQLPPNNGRRETASEMEFKAIVVCSLQHDARMCDALCVPRNKQDFHAFAPPNRNNPICES